MNLLRSTKLTCSAGALTFRGCQIQKKSWHCVPLGAKTTHSTGPKRNFLSQPSQPTSTQRPTFLPHQYSFASLKSSFKVSPTPSPFRHRTSASGAGRLVVRRTTVDPEKTSSTVGRRLHLQHFKPPNTTIDEQKADLSSDLEVLFGFAIMGISRDSRHKRSATGAKRAYYRKKR